MGIATSPTIDPRAASFVAKQGKLLINNRWVDAASGKTFTTYNPATGEPLARDAARPRTRAPSPFPGCAVGGGA